MTLEHDRLLGILIPLAWFLMSLAFGIEIGALIGWIFGDAWQGAFMGAVLSCLAWLRLLAD